MWKRHESVGGVFELIVVTHLAKHDMRLGETVKSLNFHSSANHYLSLNYLNTRIRSHRHRQQEDQTIQYCIKEIRMLNDVVNTPCCGQGVGEKRASIPESRELIRSSTRYHEHCQKVQIQCSQNSNIKLLQTLMKL